MWIFKKKSQVCKCAKKLSKKFRPRVEQLESRSLLSADYDSGLGDPQSWDYTKTCGCPICAGKGLEEIPLMSASNWSSSQKYPLSTLPALNSLPDARASLFLDFNGSNTGNWGSFSNVVTPVYDIDNDETTFSGIELNWITEIWQRVAEDYAPFKINVTTVDPGNLINKRTAVIAIGGNHSDWYNSPAGGVAYVGGFYNAAPNVGFVFEDALGNGNPKYVAEAASHEAGHLFGLTHQSEYDGNTKVKEYSEGSNGWTPIMGVGYYQNVTTWHDGSTPSGVNFKQDDIAILAGSENGFGFRSDDYGSSTSTAFLLNRITEKNAFSVDGVISSSTDIDVFSFVAKAGTVSLKLTGIGTGQNFDGSLEVRNATGTVVASAATSSLNETLSKRLTSGTYFVYVKSSGLYGRLGHYTLSGRYSVQELPVPKMSVTLARKPVVSGGAAVDFGSVKPRQQVTKTFTIKNTGKAPLTLTSVGKLPTGYTLTKTFKPTTLAPGRSLSVSLKFVGTSSKSYKGTFTIFSNDDAGNKFSIPLSAEVSNSSARSSAASSASSIQVIDNSSKGFTKRGAWATENGNGVGNSTLVSKKGSGQNTATYTFTKLPKGTYTISSTWSASSSLATNTPYSIKSGSKTVANLSVNQERAPRSFKADGVSWSRLANVKISGGTLTITITNRGNDNVMADAIRIERVSAAPTLDGSAEPEDGLITFNPEHQFAEDASVDLSAASSVMSAQSPRVSSQLEQRLVDQLDEVYAAVESLLTGSDFDFECQTFEANPLGRKEHFGEW
jgi:hypothetical protein